MAKEKQIAVVEEPKTQALVAAENEPMLGFENFNMGKDLIIPRLRLLQGLSQAVTDGDGKIGQFQDSLTGEILGDEVEVVIVGFKNGAVMFEQGEGMVCRSQNGVTNEDGIPCSECPYGEYHAKKWKKGEEPPKCSSSRDFLCVTRKSLNGDEQRPIMVSFVKTSYKVGGKLISLAYLAGKSIFANSYKISSRKESNKKGTFAVYEISNGSRLEGAELEAAQSWFTRLHGAKVQVVDNEGDGEAIEGEAVTGDDIEV